MLLYCASHAAGRRAKRRQYGRGRPSTRMPAVNSTRMPADVGRLSIVDRILSFLKTNKTNN
jgi:hypothetical protein